MGGVGGGGGVGVRACHACACVLSTTSKGRAFVVNKIRLQSVDSDVYLCSGTPIAHL